MNFLWTLLFMMVIGALIGGFTNHLAIKMLFRPYEAKYIGSWRLPFTPGLIPKRRDELATQLGRTVTNYLLTPETFKKKLLTAQMEAKAEAFLQEQLNTHILHSDRTIEEWFQLTGASNIASQAEGKIEALLEGQFERIRQRVTTGTIEEIVPESILVEANEKIPQITSYILNEADTYFQSEEGKATIKRLIDDFLASKGTFGNMLNMFFGESDTLANKFQKEASKFLNASGTFDMLYQIIDGEWGKLKQRPLSELLQEFDWERLLKGVKRYIRKELAIDVRLNKPLKAYWPTASDWTSANFTPKLVHFAFEQAEGQLEKSLRKLKLDDMVKEQVDSFPVDVLEDLVLGISRREFKMITVLGAVLGGAIGIIQGLIVFITN